MNDKPTETFIKVNTTGNDGFAVVARIFLVCLCCAGFGLYFSVAYKIPAPSPVVFGLYGVIFGLLFSILPILLDKVILWIIACIGVLISLVLLHFEVNTLGKDFYWFGNYMLNILDGDKFATKTLAIPLSAIIGNDGAVSGVCTAAVIIFAFVCFLYCAGSRSKGIGVILLVTIIFAAPAFAANLAGYIFGVEFMLAGMFGLYVMWTMCGSVPSPTVVKTALLGRFSGTLPMTRMFGRTAVFAAVLAFVCVFAGTRIITYDNYYNNKFQQVITELSDKASQAFGWNSRLNDNNYFAQGKNERDATLSTRPPSLSLRKIVEVTAQDNAPIYLKGDIGYDYINNSWTTTGNTAAFSEINQISETYYPEMTYPVFKRKVEDAGYDPTTIFGEENITLEYLINTKMVFLPTMPFDFTYKNNDMLYSDKDTILRVNSDKTFIGKFNMRVAYPKIWNVNEWSDIYKSTLDKNEDASKIIPDFSSEYTQVSQYEALLPAVYSGVPETEKANIKRLSNDIHGYDDVTMFDKLATAEQYFKSQYTYSLTADNLNGKNTLLGNFLFETKSGHCALYATAFTLYARMLGLPARYVTGYITRGFTKSDNNSYKCTIRENNAHAWVEVYLDGVGWLPFDPTPNSIISNAEATTIVNETTNVVTTEQQNTTSPITTSNVDEPTSLTSASAPTVAAQPDQLPPPSKHSPIIFIVIIAVVAGTSVFIFFNYVNYTESRLFDTIIARKNVRAATELMYKLLDFAQLKPMTGEMPLQFAKRVDDMNIVTERLQKIMPCIEKSEFGNERINSDEYEQLKTMLKELRCETVENVKFGVSIKRKISILKLGGNH